MLRDSNNIYFVIKLQRILDLNELQMRDPWSATEAVNYGLGDLGRKRGFKFKEFPEETFTIEDYYQACVKVFGEKTSFLLISLLFDARKRFAYYHTPAFFQEEGESKLVYGVIITEKENWQDLLDTIEKLIPQKNRKYYL